MIFLLNLELEIQEIILAGTERYDTATNPVVFKLGGRLRYCLVDHPLDTEKGIEFIISLVGFLNHQIRQTYIVIEARIVPFSSSYLQNPLKLNGNEKC